MWSLERRRAKRSRKPFVLMVLGANLENGSAGEILRQAVDVILTSKRETDIIGWYKESAILGVIFAEVNIEGECLVTETLRTKIETLLAKHLGRGKAAKIAISLHVFPESWDRNQSGWVADTKLYPDIDRRTARKRLSLVSKRVMDVLGSGALLLALSPLLAALAPIIHLTSKGPLIFDQQRRAHLATRFNSLKF